MKSRLKSGRVSPARPFAGRENWRANRRNARALSQGGGQDRKQPAGADAKKSKHIRATVVCPLMAISGHLMQCGIMSAFGGKADIVSIGD